MSEVALKDFDILSDQERAEAVALLKKYDQLEKQEDCQAGFFASAAYKIRVCVYLFSRLDDGLERQPENNPDNSYRGAGHFVRPQNKKPHRQ